MPCAIKLASSGLRDELYKPAPLDQHYNLKTNDTFHSQFAQDLILWPILKNTHNGFFVESGALDGEAGSNTLFYEKRGWTGLLVEPNPAMFATLLTKHRHAYAFNGALSPTGSRTKVMFSQHPSDLGCSWINPISSDDWKNERNPTPLGNSSYEVNCESLMSLLAALNRTTVDFWSLDIEGAEGPVLQSTDFNKIEVGVLMTEANSDAINKTLTANGFKLIGYTHHMDPKGPIHDIRLITNTTNWSSFGDSVYVNPDYFAKRGFPVPTSLDRSSGVETCRGVCKEWFD